MRQSTILFALLSSLPSIHAQAQPDGAIVPFTSGLPACASLCGPLFDVQGKCSPPAMASVDDNCFCTDARLTRFDTEGTAGVQAVCGAASCTSTADLAAVKEWYDAFCKTKTAATTTGTGATGAAPTATSSSGSGASTGGSSSSTNNGSWMSTHSKWVIMLVILIIVITGGWILACIFRKRYLRKKEKEFEMRPPVEWGPHQLQAMTGGYNYGGGANEKGKNAVYGAKAVPEGKRDSKVVKKTRR